jgi:hypothetical protein
MFLLFLFNYTFYPIPIAAIYPFILLVEEFSYHPVRSSREASALPFMAWSKQASGGRSMSQPILK